MKEQVLLKILFACPNCDEPISYVIELEGKKLTTEPIEFKRLDSKKIVGKIENG